MKTRTIALFVLSSCTAALAVAALGVSVGLFIVLIAGIAVAAAWLRLVGLLAEREAALTAQLARRLPHAAPVADLHELQETLTVSIARVPGEGVRP